MLAALEILKVAHVAFASVWFGSRWVADVDVRRTIELGRPHVDVLPQRIRRLEWVAIPCGAMTLVTGLALAAWVYGLWTMPPWLRVVLGMTLGTMAVGALLVTPTWRRIAAMIRNAEDLGKARVAAVWFARYVWLEHSLLLATLAIVVTKTGHAQ